MLKFLSIEARALRQPGPVARLRYLRTAERRRVRVRNFAVQGARVSLVTAVLLCGNQLGRSKSNISVRPMADAPIRSLETRAGNLFWVVEETAARTLYSNGLVVRRDFETDSVPRRYSVYRRDTLERSAEAGTRPAGIVFHTTESQILPLEAERNRALLRSREDVLAHARSGRLYNFVIDRFGQVSRIVPEAQTALHAGHSVWASGESVWVDLNESFLGVSFEAETAQPFQPSAAQIHSGRLLTEVLRSQYRIPEANCVTHAQVSVNPDNMRLGYHTDWGNSFPFAALGLQGGYNLPVSSVTVFGFEHDETFLRATNNQLWPGLLSADGEIAEEAVRKGITANEWKARLQQRYKILRRQRHG